MTAKHHTIQRRMVDSIDQQLAGHDGSWVLRMKPAKLELVRRFVLSFIAQGDDHTVPYVGPDELPNLYLTVPKTTGADEIAALRADRVRLQGEIERLTHELNRATGALGLLGDTVPEGFKAPAYETHIVGVFPQAEIEALAQRLAKVEDRLSTAEGALRGQMQRFEKMGQRLDGLNQHKRVTALEERIVRAATDARLDQVCEIIGERIGGLEERLNANVENVTHDRLRIDAILTRLDRLEQAPERFVLHDNVKVTNDPLPGVQPSPPGFPTGAGTTVEDAVAVAEAEAWTAAIAQVEEPGAESEPLKPQRGDRVRLEGARSLGNTKVDDGWYDVIGGAPGDFQVDTGFGSNFWIDNADPGLKEVRRGAAELEE